MGKNKKIKFSIVLSKNKKQPKKKNHKVNV